MRESRDLVPVAPLLVTVVAVIGLTSAVWSIIWQWRDTTRAEQIAQLEHRLEKTGAERSALLDRYTAAEKARHKREVELLKLQNTLDETRRQLAALENSNWPERYADLEQDNYELSERIKELELRSSIDRDNYTARYEDLRRQYEDLQREYDRLDSEHGALEQDTAATATRMAELEQALDETRQELGQQAHLRHALQRDLIAQEISADRVDNRITILERERQSLQAALADSEQRIKALQQQNKQLDAELQAAQKRNSPSPVQTVTARSPQPAVPATAGNQTNPGFRLARVQSLQSALRDASSSDKKSILLTVLPTIPGGVKGSELAGLVAGMDSSHIIEVIEKGRPHIQRPVDNDSYERIMQQLDDGESRRLVTRLLQ